MDYQLDADSIDNSFLESLLADLFPSLAMTYSEIFAALDANEDFEPASELIVATIARQLFSPRQLFEVVTEFWTNHFNVFLLDGPVQYLKTVDDRDNVRPNALGSFGDLLRVSVVSLSQISWAAFRSGLGMKSNHVNFVIAKYNLRAALLHHSMHEVQSFPDFGATIRH